MTTDLIEAVKTDNLNACHILLSGSGCCIDAQNKYGCTAVSYAYRNGHIDCLKFLLQHNAAVNIKSNEGWAPIHFIPTSEKTCLELLLAAGANINDTTPDGDTPLILGAYFHNSNYIKALLDNRANPDIRDKNGNTALDIAIKSKDYVCIKILSEYHQNKGLATKAAIHK
jgi:uncharacterized protein